MKPQTRVALIVFVQIWSGIGIALAILFLPSLFFEFSSLTRNLRQFYFFVTAVIGILLGIWIPRLIVKNNVSSADAEAVDEYWRDMILRGPR
jgi:predicted membrane-bound spermidine synthase